MGNKLPDRKPNSQKSIFSVIGSSIIILPLPPAYVFLFIKKHGFTFTTIKALARRLSWIVLLSMVLLSSFLYVIYTFSGGPWTDNVDKIAEHLNNIEVGIAGALGMGIGFWGWLLVFILHFVMSFRHRAKQ